MTRSGSAGDRRVPGRRLPGAPRPPDRKKRWLVVGAVCMAAGMLIAVSTQYARTYTLARQAARLEQKRQALEAANHSLRVDIQRLQTDDRYIEKLAREQLGLLRPGEVELQIVASGSDHSGADPEPDAGGAVPESSLSAPSGWLEQLRVLVESVLQRLRR